MGMAGDVDRPGSANAPAGRFSLAEVVRMNPILKRLLLNRSFWLASLLIFMTISFSIGLSAGIRGGITWLLIPIAVFGSLAGYGLAHSRLKGWQAGCVLAISGISGITFHFANLAEPLGGFIKAIILLRVQIIDWIRDRVAPSDLSYVIIPLVNFYERTSTLLTRTWIWLQGLKGGVVTTDLAARAFIWCIGVFLLVAWAGWILGRFRNPLAAFTPLMAMLAIVSDYTGTGFNFVWLMLGGILLLMGVARYDVDRVRWQRTGIDFSESIPVDTGSAIIIISVALVGLAWITPSFSVKALVETIRDMGKSREEIAGSFGLYPAPPPPSKFAPYIAPRGLPNSHLLGSGPELSEQVVMTIRTGELPPRPQSSNPPPAPRHYWRGVTYDRYTGTGWVSSPVGVNSYDANSPLLEVSPEGYRLVHQDVKIYGDLGGQIHWSGNLVIVNQPMEAAWRSRPGTSVQFDPFSGADLLGVISPVKSYMASSLEASISAEKLRTSSSPYPAWTATYLTLPETTPERVLSLAWKLTANAATPYDRALALESYLRSTYPYTLDIPAPPAGRDVADYFLFDLKKGYCDYYATAMVVLARAAGLPARFVSGYASGYYDSDNAQYIVTEANAHSWVEIFFSDIGWVEFEPTAGLPAIDRLIQPSYQALPVIPQETEGKITTSIIMNWLGILIKGMALVFLIIVLIAISALWIESCILFLQPVNLSLSQIFRRLEKEGGHVMHRESGLTPFEFSSKIKSKMRIAYNSERQPFLFRPFADEIDLITEAYVQSVYSSHQIQRGYAAKSIHAWRRLRLRLFWLEIHSILSEHRGSNNFHRYITNK
jgi:transglutaminase-like putative cysteine protease